MILKDIGRSSPRIGPEKFKRKSKIDSLSAASDVADYLIDEMAVSHDGVEILDYGAWLVENKSDFLAKLEVQERRFKDLNGFYRQTVRTLSLCEHFVCSFPHDTKLTEDERIAFDSFLLENRFSRYPALKAWHLDKEREESKPRKVHVHYLVMNFDLELVPGYLDKAIRLRDSRNDFIGAITSAARKGVDNLNLKRELSIEHEEPNEPNEPIEKIEGTSEARAQRWKINNAKREEKKEAALVRFEEAFCDALRGFLPRNNEAAKKIIERAIKGTGWEISISGKKKNDESIYLIPPGKANLQPTEGTSKKPKSYRYSWIWFRAKARETFLERAKIPRELGRDFDRLAIGIFRLVEKGRTVDTRTICSAIGKLDWRYRIRDGVFEFTTRSGACCRQAVEDLTKDLDKRLKEISHFEYSDSWYKELAFRVGKHFVPRRRLKRKLIKKALFDLGCQVEFIRDSLLISDDNLNISKTDLKMFEKRLLESYFHSVLYSKAENFADKFSIIREDRDNLCNALLEFESLKMRQYQGPMERAGFHCWSIGSEVLLRDLNGDDYKIKISVLRKVLLGKLFGPHEISRESLEAGEQDWLELVLFKMPLQILKKEDVVDILLEELKASCRHARSENGAVYFLDPGGRPKMIVDDLLKLAIERTIESNRVKQKEQLVRFIEDRLEKVSLDRRVVYSKRFQDQSEKELMAPKYLRQLLQLNIDSSEDPYLVSDVAPISGVDSRGGLFEKTLFENYCLEKMTALSGNIQKEIDEEVDRRLKRVAEVVSKKGVSYLSEAGNAEGLESRNHGYWNYVNFMWFVECDLIEGEFLIARRDFKDCREFLREFRSDVEPDAKEREQNDLTVEETKKMERGDSSDVRTDI